MCNIVGYVGDKNATEILFEMLKVQEGIDGGFFTGIAVHDGKKLNYRKVVGDIKKLIETTSALNLKGNTGIMHSRTPSKGDSEWSHPFYSCLNGELDQCYVVNGSLGCYKNNILNYNEGCA